MSELAFITAAKRQRDLMETQYRLNRRHANATDVRQRFLTNSKRKAQLIDQKVEQNAQSLRDRRKDMEFEAQTRQILAKQQQEIDTIASDALFKQTRKTIEIELNSSRDGREASESNLLRNMELKRIEAEELTALAQRAADTRKALIEWESRISERRTSERNANIQAATDLRLSIDRISATNLSPLDLRNASLGQLLDVQA